MHLTAQSWEAAWQLVALHEEGAVAGCEDSRQTASGLEGLWLSHAEETELLRATTLYFCLSLLLATVPPRVPFRCYAYPPGDYPYAARALTCDS